ncbi:NAD(P)H-dependent oxidoreductase [Marinobacter alkaliphilus]|uniref:NAD(P)H-dependent oxidoreductase n=2 Tax=Marinobacter TaxID=2742 RepID=A0A455W4T5_MARNT|nr:NAD(P)H-dependent oxidoreductase [Marinobacter nauticus]
MNIHQALDWRYAVRQFSPEKLDNRAVESLLDAARKSASSYGLQPYKILVVESREVRQALLAHSFGQQRVLDSSHLVIFAALTDIGDHTVDRYVDQFVRTRRVPADEIDGYVQHMKGALAAKTSAEKKVWAHQQAYIALGTLLTAAAAMRIDSCPMTGFDHKAYDKVLGLTEFGLESTAIVALGYRSELDSTADLPKVRFDYEEIVMRV